MIFGLCGTASIVALLLRRRLHKADEERARAELHRERKELIASLIRLKRKKERRANKCQKRLDKS